MGSCGVQASGVGRFLLGGSKENQHFQFFLDVIEPVLALCLDENDRTRAHLGVLGTDLHAGAAADYVIQFILVVGLLRIGGTGSENIHTRAHGRYPEEFEVAFAAGNEVLGEIVEMKEVGQIAARSELVDRVLATVLRERAAKEDFSELPRNRFPVQPAFRPIPLIDPVNHSEQSEGSCAWRYRRWRASLPVNVEPEPASVYVGSPPEL